jgi:alkanesulfonate monooxygenase SsuD/methylene tetrahydromethanopterin reductase-like flavin-dependent oxidoreductase (luciferase family)
VSDSPSDSTISAAVGSTGRGPHFAVMLPQMRMSYATIEERVQSAEANGFHSVWFMDHLTPPVAPEHDAFEGWTLTSALAMRTSTIRLGHLVLCNEFRHPALLAKMAATLDVLSEGRLELGLGWGSVPHELEVFGFGLDPAPVRAARLGETLAILSLMFAGEPFDYDGEHFQLRGAIGRPVPLQSRVPIMIGGAGPKLTMPLVAAHADWWNCPTYAIDRLAELAPLAGSARISAQHPLGLAASSADRDEVVATAERRFGGWGGLIAGTPDEVTAALQREVDLGVELFIFQFTDFAPAATLERFATEVMPAFR